MSEQKKMSGLKILKSIDIPTVRAEHFRSVYVNHATAGLTTWDLHFTIGTLIEQAPGKPCVEEQIMLMMTYEFARAFSDSLLTTIKAYEARPPDLEPTQELLAAKPKKS